MEWNGTTELQCMIDSVLCRIAGDFSLLIVCLMSHGCRGVLRASDGEEIPVNNILNQFSYTLPEYIPLVNTHNNLDIHHNLIFLYVDLPICSAFAPPSTHKTIYGIRPSGKHHAYTLII